MDKETIPARLEYLKAHCPDKESFVFFTPHSREVFTFADIYNLAARFACRLRDRGFQRHDVIANTLPNSPERLVTDLGILFAGCIPLNGQLVLASGDDFFRSARAARCRAAVVWPGGSHHAWRLLSDDVTESGNSLFSQLTCAKAEEMTTAILVSRGETTRGCSLLKELTSGDCYVADVTPDDPAYLFTTSGSTGYSKLVPHSNKYFFDIHNFGKSNTEKMKHNLKYNISNFNARPFGWLLGFPMTTYITAQKRVTLDRSYDFNDKEEASLTWKIINEENVATCVIMSREFYSILKDVPQLEPADRVSSITVSGQPITKSVVEDIFKLAKSSMILYGSTEIGYISGKLVRYIEDFSDFCVGESYVENIRIVSKDLQECPPGQLGTVWIKDSRACSGYFMPLNPNASRPADVFLADGWFNTEDIGCLDDDGDLYVFGRQADVITYGAHQVYPGWLEKEMTSHPRISQVVVVPVSDPVLFQEICACVKPTPGATLTEASLREIAEEILVKEGNSDTTPIPKYFIVLEDLPALSSGKTDRKLIKKMAEERFGKSNKS